MVTKIPNAKTNVTSSVLKSPSLRIENMPSPLQVFGWWLSNGPLSDFSKTQLIIKLLEYLMFLDKNMDAFLVWEVDSLLPVKLYQFGNKTNHQFGSLFS